MRLVLLTVLAACGGAGQGAGASKPSSGAPAEAEPPAAQASGAVSPNANAAVPVAPSVVVTGEVRASGGVDLVLQNHDAAPVTFAAEVAVERVGSGAPEPFAPSALALRFSCEAAPVACLELVPGAESRPPPWLTAKGRAQCGERGAEPAPPGSYRFVVRTCDGARIEGEPFELR